MDLHLTAYVDYEIIKSLIDEDTYIRLFIEKVVIERLKRKQMKDYESADVLRHILISGTFGKIRLEDINNTSTRVISEHICGVVSLTEELPFKPFINDEHLDGCIINEDGSITYIWLDNNKLRSKTSWYYTRRPIYPR